MLRKLLAIALLPICLTCVSCSKLPTAAGRWPRIDIGAAPDWTPAEKAELAQISKDHPALTKKIVARNNEMAVAIKTYNKQAAQGEREFEKLRGYSDDEIKRMLKALGFEDDEL